jgi:hypothetical protein
MSGKGRLQIRKTEFGFHQTKFPSIDRVQDYLNLIHLVPHSFISTPNFSILSRKHRIHFISQTSHKTREITAEGSKV